MTKWKAGGVELPHGPYMIGAGVCKTPAMTGKWLQVAPVVSGSYTMEQRSGNSGKVMWPETFGEMLAKGGALNSYSMPNGGLSAVVNTLGQIKVEHPLIVSIAGFSAGDYIEGARIVAALPNVAAVEFNWGCPNTQGDHPDITSFNPPTVKEILFGMCRVGYRLPLWLKFSPFSNPAELKRMAEMVNGFAAHLQLAVVTCNTFPNAYAGKGNIDPNGGMAGLSGPAMKLIAMGQVRQFRQYLRPEVDIIGVGGVTSGNDIVDLLDAGASAVQTTTWPHLVGDPRLFQERLLDPEVSGKFLSLIGA